MRSPTAAGRCARSRPGWRPSSRADGEDGAPGESRTRTGQDLNLVPLPVGLRARSRRVVPHSDRVVSRSPRGREPGTTRRERDTTRRSVEAEVAAQLGDVAARLDVVLRELDGALFVDHEGGAEDALD